MAIKLRWQEVADGLRAYVEPASDDQLVLAAHVGLKLNGFLTASSW